MQDQRGINGDFMSKKNKHKNNSDNEFLDMSYRNKIDIDVNREYDDEELLALINELDKQLQELNNLHKKLYLSNAYINRIYHRTFWDILHKKLDSIWKNLSSKKEHRIAEKG